METDIIDATNITIRTQKMLKARKKNEENIPILYKLVVLSHRACAGGNFSVMSFLQRQGRNARQALSAYSILLSLHNIFISLLFPRYFHLCGGNTNYRPLFLKGQRSY